MKKKLAITAIIAIALVFCMRVVAATTPSESCNEDDCCFVPVFTIFVTQEYPCFTPVATIIFSCNEQARDEELSRIAAMYMAQTTETMTAQLQNHDTTRMAEAAAMHQCIRVVDTTVTWSSNSSFCSIRVTTYTARCRTCNRLMSIWTEEEFGRQHSWTLQIVNGTLRSVCIHCGWTS